MTTRHPDPQQLKLAAQVNIKYRKFFRACDKASAPYPSQADLARSNQTNRELGEFMRQHEVHDHADGEHFSLVNEDGSTFTFRIAMTGDPIYAGYFANPEA